MVSPRKRMERIGFYCFLFKDSMRFNELYRLLVGWWGRGGSFFLLFFFLWLAMVASFPQMERARPRVSLSLSLSHSLAGRKEMLIGLAPSSVANLTTTTSMSTWHNGSLDVVIHDWRRPLFVSVCVCPDLAVATSYPPPAIVCASPSLMLSGQRENSIRIRSTKCFRRVAMALFIRLGDVWIAILQF